MAASKVVIRKGDVTQATEPYIAHQCNCVSHVVAGVAKAIFSVYPVAGWYLNTIQTNRPEIGSVEFTDTEGKRIINMFAQYYPGKPRAGDTAPNRLRWFVGCLNKITICIKPGARIAMPYRIGCGLAGGDMTAYMKAIEDWSKHEKIEQVVLYDNN